MKVNFNNARKTAAVHLDELIKKLNQAIEYELIDGDIVSDIVPNIERLQQTIVTICCTYDPNDEENFSDLSDDIDIREFNPEED